MIDNTEESYNEEEDLGIIIDDRIQLGKTAARIQLAQSTADVLAQLLIEKGIFTADEFTQKMKIKEHSLIQMIDSSLAEMTEPNLQASADAKRFKDTITRGIDAICKKVVR